MSDAGPGRWRPADDVRWDGEPRSGRGRPPAMSAATIATAAIALAAENGLDAISMARVAARLEFTTMSLYRHVASKAELVELMVDTAIGPAPGITAADRGWREALTDWARRLRDLFRRHPWLLAATGRPGRILGPHELEWFDAAVGVLADAGLAPGELQDAALLVLGHVRTAIQFAAHDEDAWVAATAAHVRRRPDRFPALVRTIDPDAVPASDDQRFEFGLGAILDGLAHRTG